jgi:hypothetical protein
VCTTDSTSNKITIASADSNIQWSDIRITNSSTIDCHWAIFANGGITNQSTNVIPTGEVIAGDYLKIWGVTGNVQFTWAYMPTNSLLGIWTINV